MKLITETIERVDYITEEVNGKKALYIQGPFLVGEQVNKNGRLYPLKLLEREAASYIKERIEGNCAWGELNHPATPSVNLDRACIMVKELKREGNDFVGKAKVLESQPMGQIVRGLIEEGGRLGVSSRGVGSLKEDNRGYKIVQDDYKLCVAADVVADPSGPGAFVNGILENAEWIYDAVTGTWVEEKVCNTRTTLKKMTKEERERNALRLFETLLTDIARLK